MDCRLFLVRRFCWGQSLHTLNTGRRWGTQGGGQPERGCQAGASLCRWDIFSILSWETLGCPLKTHRGIKVAHTDDEEKPPHSSQGKLVSLHSLPGLTLTASRSSFSASPIPEQHLMFSCSPSALECLFKDYSLLLPRL